MLCLSESGGRALRQTVCPCHRDPHAFRCERSFRNRQMCYIAKSGQANIISMRAYAFRMNVYWIFQSISSRLKQSVQFLWHLIGAVPVTFKIIGLIILPVLAVGVGGAWFIREQLAALLRAHSAQSIQAAIFLDLTRQTAIVLGMMALFGLALSTLFAQVLIHPLQDLIRAMRRVQAGDLTAEISVWADDEIGKMQAEFNLMMHNLRESRMALSKQQTELEKLNQENTRLLRELNAKNSRLEQLLHHAISAQEAERKRLARELHDETGQSLTSILLRLKALQTETDLETIHDRLNGLRYLTSRTLEEIRRLALDLRPMALDDLGLAPAIRWYVQQCAERSGIDVKLSIADTSHRLPAELEIVLYRAVQEGLTNIIRHARAKQATISLEQSRNTVWLTITDDGQGIQPGSYNHGGMGLEGMRERVVLVGGRLRVDSTPGAGTQIVIELPLKQN